MDITWDYTNQREYVRGISEGMPPVIISAVVTGGHQKSENPAMPVTAAEQAEAAAAVFAAGATIVHNPRSPGGRPNPAIARGGPLSRDQ